MHDILEINKLLTMNEIRG